MLGQLARHQEPDGRLHLTAGDGGTVAVLGQARGLRGQLLEHVVDKGVHDAHGLGGDGEVWMHLQDGNQTPSHTPITLERVGAPFQTGHSNLKSTCNCHPKGFKSWAALNSV